jgi:hypothetical protein
MAADTIRIAGKQLNRKTVYIAGAAAVGIVGYAWWTRKPIVPDEVVTEDELDAIGDERIPTTGVPYDPNTGAPSSGIVTNAEWTQFATDRMLSLGYDPLAVSDALGKFLDRKPLSAAEANLARAAMGQAGEPPVGRPWTVIQETVPASVGMGAPAGFKAMLIGWRSSTPIYRLSWGPVQGAKDYHLIHVGGSQGFVANTTVDNQGSAPGKVDKWRVAARNPANVIGPYTDLAFTAAVKSGTSPAPKPGTTGSPPRTPPGFINVSSPHPGQAWMRFIHAPGATQYRWRYETAKGAAAWHIYPKQSSGGFGIIRASGPRGVTVAYRVQAGNRYGWGPAAKTRNVNIRR